MPARTDLPSGGIGSLAIVRINQYRKIRAGACTMVRTRLLSELPRHSLAWTRRPEIRAVRRPERLLLENRCLSFLEHHRAVWSEQDTFWLLAPILRDFEILRVERNRAQIATKSW